METTYTRNELHPGSFLVYIAGIEVPFKSIRREWTVGQHPTLSVDMIPDKSLRGLGREDKLPISVFYLDSHYAAKPVFCLYFDGFIEGWSYQNTAANKSITLRCAHHSKIFNELTAQYLTSFNDMTVGTLTPDPATIPFPHFSGTFPASLLYSGLNATEVTATITRPYEIFENILRACGGIDEILTLGAPLSSSFFLRYMRRFNFFNRTLPSPLIETDPDFAVEGVFPILKAVRTEQTISTLQQRLASIGSGQSLWDTVQILYLSLLYEILVIPSAPIAQVSLTPATARGKVLGKPAWNMSDKAKRDIAQGQQKGSAFADRKVHPDPAKPNRLINCLTKPQAIYGLPPMCNAIFPSMMLQHAFDEDYASQPSRLYVGDMQTTTLLEVGGDKKWSELTRVRTGYPDEVREAMEAWGGSGEKQGNPFLSNKNFLIWPDEYFRGPHTREERLPEWFPYLNDVLRYASSDDPDAYNKARKELSATFAQYEFFRRRGATRRGGVTTCFNPYIVPGFSGFVFDRTKSGQHLHVYVVSVTDNISPQGMQTSVGYAFAQTLDEFLEASIEARKDHADLAAGPALPIEVVRNVFQNLTNAERYFNELLHQGEQSPSTARTAVFDVRKAIQLVLTGGTKISLLDDEQTAKYLEDAITIAPTDTYVDCFEYADAALKRVSRPVCTLEDYINFHPNGYRGGAIGATDDAFGKGARYYTKIMDYAIGPGDAAPTLGPDNTPAEFNFDLRRDWIKRLKTYRARVLSDTHPQEG